jgi:aspartate/methionine/tyrosine aminotransferase
MGGILAEPRWLGGGGLWPGPGDRSPGSTSAGGQDAAARGDVLAWLDLRAYGHDDPAAVAATGGVRLAAGHDFQPGLTGHVRLNLATSPERLTEIVRRLGSAVAAG